MKFLPLLAFIISLASISSKKVSSTKNKSRIRSLEHKKMEEMNAQFGPQSQLSDMQGQSSLTYGYGTSDRTLGSYVGLQSAKLMERIPIHLNPTFPYTGVTTEANGSISGNRLYYDGRNNINAVHVQCTMYTSNPQGCVHNSQCGWCGSTSSCISANISGPLAPCLRSTFLYTAPGPFWNPARAGDINIRTWDEKKRLPQTLLTTSPNNIDEASVYNPYM